jgi:hypothetical protein
MQIRWMQERRLASVFVRSYWLQLQFGGRRFIALSSNSAACSTIWHSKIWLQQFCKFFLIYIFHSLLYTTIEIHSFFPIMLYCNYIIMFDSNFVSSFYFLFFIFCYRQQLRYILFFQLRYNNVGQWTIKNREVDNPLYATVTVSLLIGCIHLSYIGACRSWRDRGYATNLCNWFC